MVNTKRINAQTYVLIPDPNFAAYLQTVIPTAMNGNSLDITNTLVTTTQTLINVQSKGISNLSGIQYFSSLTFLNCQLNSLTSLPALPNSLQTLWCTFNSLTTLPTLPNSLQTLFCHFNSINTLPSLPNSLTYLDCNTNSLTTLPSLPNSLTYLDCNTNSLAALPALPNSLQTLYCEHNSFTALPSLPNSLTDLSCRYNSLTALPVLPSSLQTLYCSYSTLTSLPALPNSLVYLDCSYNTLTALPVLPNSLKQLYCENNNILCFPHIPDSIIPASYDNHFPIYRYYIDLSNNPFTCLPNYLLSAMQPNLLAVPLCTTGNLNGCPDGIIGIKELKLNNEQVSIFPNPTNGQFIIETISTYKQMMQLFDLKGKLVFSENINGKITIDATSLWEGVYNLTLKSSEGVLNKKLVIVR